MTGCQDVQRGSLLYIISARVQCQAHRYTPRSGAREMMMMMMMMGRARRRRRPLEPSGLMRYLT